jgi:hypothetical protein
MKILVVTANPKQTERLRMDLALTPLEEKGKIRRAGSERIVKYKFGATLDDLRKGLDEHHPEVVHFAGHGDAQFNLVFDDGHGGAKPLDPDVVAELCKLLADKTRVVLLNACHTEATAKTLTDGGDVEFAIGWRGTTYEVPAGTFAGAFYESLDNANSIQSAFNNAKASLLEVADKVTPVLCLAANADPERRLCGRLTTQRIRITPPEQMSGPDYRYGVMLVGEGLEGDAVFNIINEVREMSSSGRHRQLDVQYQEHLGLLFKCCVELPQGPEDIADIASAFERAGWGKPEQERGNEKLIWFLLNDPRYVTIQGKRFVNNYIPHTPEIPR